MLDDTCSHRFRSAYDVNHWLMKEWQIVSGKIRNRSSSKFGKVFFIRKLDIGNEIINYIKFQKGKVICINDSDLTSDKFDALVPKIAEAFEKIMPEKSSFEK